jgi:hypothetical protein
MCPVSFWWEVRGAEGDDPTPVLLAAFPEGDDPAGAEKAAREFAEMTDARDTTVCRVSR